MKAMSLLACALGGLAGMIAALSFGFAILAYLGILADVGDQENRQIGLQLMWIGACAAVASIVIVVFAWLLQRRATVK